MNASTSVGFWAVTVALIACFFELGGSLYEYLVIDRVWPTNLALIQPAHGGVDRKVFWMPLHGVLTLALPVALWACWAMPGARFWLVVSLVFYVVLRAWTFAYFIPKVIAFEKGELVDLAQAKTWVRLSLLRAPLLIGVTCGQFRAWELLLRVFQRSG